MQPSTIPWELIWRVVRVGLLAIMGELIRELSPLVVQGDTPVNFGPGFLSGLVWALSAAEAVYAALKQLGWIKTKDVPAVKDSRYAKGEDYVAYLRSNAGQPVYVLPVGSVVDVVTSDGRSVMTARPAEAKPDLRTFLDLPPFSGPLHDPAKDTPQPADPERAMHILRALHQGVSEGLPMCEMPH